MPLWQLLFSLNGRIPRAHWWVGIISSTATGVILAGAAALVLGEAHGGVKFVSPIAWTTYIWCVVALWLAVACVQISLSMKRLQDRGRPGWALFLGIFPPIALWFLFEMAFLEGERRTNAWGPPFGRRDLSALREEFHRNDLFE